MVLMWWVGYGTMGQWPTHIWGNSAPLQCLDKKIGFLLLKQKLLTCYYEMDFKVKKFTWFCGGRSACRTVLTPLAGDSVLLFPPADPRLICMVAVEVLLGSSHIFSLFSKQNCWNLIPITKCFHFCVFIFWLDFTSNYKVSPFYVIINGTDQDNSVVRLGASFFHRWLHDQAYLSHTTEDFNRVGLSFT